MHGFGGRSVAPRSRRGKKRAPLRNAREPSRYRAWPNTQNRRKVSRSSTRNSHTLPLKSPPGPLFRPIPCQNAVRVATSRRPPSDIAQKPRNRAKSPQPPTPQPPRPQTPHFAREVSQKRPRGAGAVNLWVHQPRPSLSRLRPSHRTRTTSSMFNTQAHHAGPPGGGGLPLPAAAAAAPFKTIKPKDHRAKTHKMTHFPPY